MGRGIIIKKILEFDSKYIYEVDPIRLDSDIFYILIDAKENKVIFYLDKDLKKIEGYMNFNETNIVPKMINIYHGDALRSAAQAYKAIKNNEFPRSLSIES